MQFLVRTGYWIAPAALVAACSGGRANSQPSGPTEEAAAEAGAAQLDADSAAMPAPTTGASVGSNAAVRDAGAPIEPNAPGSSGQGDGDTMVPGEDRGATLDASQDVGQGGDGPPGPSDCVGLFCEDFESGKIDPAIWDTETFGGQTVSVQSTTVAHGQFAAQFHANPNLVSYDFIITKSAPAALIGHFFGRAYFRIAPKPPTEHMEFFFAGTTGFPNLKYIEVASGGAAWQLTYVDLKVAAGQAASSPGTQEEYSGGGTIPVQTWACLEWEVNDTPDQETVYVNGTEDVSFPSITLDGVSSGLVGGFAAFGFGYYAWHPAADPIDIYYDDIVLDTKRVGCLQ